jgi:hypothetical protein
MSMSRRSITWSLTAVLCLPLAAVAQAPRNDLLEANKQMAKVAADKMEKQVSDGLAEARRLATTEPARAKSLLKKLLGDLDADTVLSDTRRTALVRLVKDRMAAVAEQKAPRGDPKPLTEGSSAEERIIKRSLEMIEKYKRDGRTAEARQIAGELASQYPENLAVKAAVRSTTVSDNLATGRQTRADNEKHVVSAFSKIDESAITPKGDLEIPKDWFQKMAKRKNVNEPVLTEKEQSILKALASPITPEYKNVSLFDVLDDLSNKLNVTFALDKASLADAGVNSDTQVNLVIPRGIAARTALRKMLGEVGLAYVIKNETIQVVTEARAKEMMVTRTYYIGNLLAGGVFADVGIRFNPWYDQLQVMQNVKNVVKLIEGSIEPSSWQSNGGQGTVTFYAPTMSLIIRQTAEVHGMLGSYSSK